jgi:acetyltransferase-like isoleucine patch superfamily enzyme
MKLLKYCYEKTHHKEAPYYFNYSVLKIVNKPIRKWVTNVLAANCPFNCFRILLYRLCGFKIGKHTFIGMRCYLDDMCHDLMSIGNNVTISYGVFFACHGKNQNHYPIVIEDGAYIGMRASILSNNKNKHAGGVIIGKQAIVGACALVNTDIPDGMTGVGIPCRIISSVKEGTRDGAE